MVNFHWTKPWTLQAGASVPEHLLLLHSEMRQREREKKWVQCFSWDDARCNEPKNTTIEAQALSTLTLVQSQLSHFSLLRVILPSESHNEARGLIKPRAPKQVRWVLTSLVIALAFTDLWQETVLHSLNLINEGKRFLILRNQINQFCTI